MDLEIFTIGNLEKDFLKKRNKVMKDSKADLVMLLNTDIKVSNYKKAVKRFGKDKNLFAVTFSPESSQKGKVLEVENANGGSSIYRRKIWNKIGGIDMMFEPYWWDDADYSARAIKKGYKIIEDGTIKVEKISKMGVDVLKRNLKSVLIQRRNYLLFLKKHKPEYYRENIFHPTVFPFVFWAEFRFFKFKGGIK